MLDAIRSLAPAAKAEWLPLDLADFDAVRACAQCFLERRLPLHLLVNNAGLAGVRGMTASGFEVAFGVNHMGHFLLTHLLLERLVRSAPARIVTVASRAHKRVRTIDWGIVRRPTASPFGIREYCTSKLANVLFSAELGRRLHGTGVSTYALHPGVVASDFWRMLPKPMQTLNRLFMISPESGARTTLHCALSAPVEESGGYYSGCQLEAPSPAGRSVALADELWRRSEGWLA